MRYYIGLGANDGYVVTQLLDAINRLRHSNRGLHVERCSSVYQAQEAHKFIAPFANAAVSVLTECGIESLRELTSELELRAGRLRNPEREMPVALDLDILFTERSDGRVKQLRESDFCVPHVAVPMWEVASEAMRHWMSAEFAQRETSVDGLRSKLWMLLSHESIRASEAEDV